MHDAQTWEANDEVQLLCNAGIKVNGTENARRRYRIISSKPTPFSKLTHINRNFDEVPHFWIGQPDWVETVALTCEELIRSDDVLAELQEERYDFGLAAAYGGCGFGVFHILGIPAYAGFSATPHADGSFHALGIPSPPSYITGPQLPPFGLSSRCFSLASMAPIGSRAELSFLDRFLNVYQSWKLNNVVDEICSVEQSKFDSVFGEFPSLLEMYKRQTFLFLNTDELIDMTRPYSSKVKYIGGIAVKEPRPLAQEYDDILNSAKKGTILFSFGSIIATWQIPQHTKREIIHAFRQFPQYNFIWKYDEIEKDASLFENATNIYLVKWIPQVELINDDRVKLFISHTGQNSYLEISYAGIPIISVPVFGDQHSNGRIAHKHGVGIHLNPRNVSSASLTWAIQEVLENPKYDQKAKEISRMLREKPYTPEQVFIDHVVFAARYPGLSDQLQLASADMSLFQYLCLDVICCIVAVAAFALLLALWAAKKVLAVVGFIRRGKQKTA
ncbi:UGT-54 protein [Aphelenchoides avenae]|nr:UGT-54 protein [Aphelenchus avenae]